MNLNLRFGRDFLNLDIPRNRLLGVFSPEHKPVRSEEEIVSVALEEPIQSPPLAKILRKGERTTIVIPDSTRRCGTKVFLTVLINTLNASGIKDSDIFILFANGSHDPQTVEQRREVVGEELLSRIVTLDHDCYNMKEMLYLGNTITGTPVFLNKNVVKAERLIVCGGVSYHHLTGYSGGPKLLNPGCAAYTTILRCHGLGVRRDTHGLNKNCNSGITRDNPIYQDIVDSTKFVQTDFNLHLLIDMNGRIIDACAGAPRESFARARKMVNEKYKVIVQKKVGLVIASCGGAPFDDDLIKSFRSLRNASKILKDNGHLILVGECVQGVGSSKFLDYYKSTTLEELTEQLLVNYRSYGNTALGLRELLQRVNVTLIGRLSSSDAQKIGIACSMNAQQVVDKAFAELSPGEQAAVIPNAHFTMTSLREN